MVFDHRTIAIESMVLQSTIGDDGFSMVNEKKRQWFSKIAIYDKKLLLEFKLPTQIEIAQSYQEHHALLPHAMWTYICQNWDLNSSKWGPKLTGEMTFVWTGKGRKASENLYQPKNTELFWTIFYISSTISLQYDRKGPEFLKIYKVR